MPRKNPLPADEIEIGRRVRIAREQRGLSRVSFATKLGTDSSTITNVEHGRAPLRYDLGISLCERLGVNPAWMVSGTLPMNYQFRFYGYSSRVPPRMPFSQAYSEYLVRLVEKSLKHAAEKAQCDVADLDAHLLWEKTWAEIAATRERRFVEWASNALKSIPSNLQPKFLDAVFSAATNFVQAHKRAITKYRKDATGTRA